MKLTRIEEAIRYEAPGHFGMDCFRLQGKEHGPTTSFWMALSELAPGGGTTLSASNEEKMYLVLSGRVTISNGVDEVELGPRDSLRIAPGEGRQLSNRTELPASVLLVMANPVG